MCQVGFTEGKWDDHQELHEAIDEYRTRRQKAAAFLQWARTRKAHKVGPTAPSACIRDAPDPKSLFVSRIPRSGSESSRLTARTSKMHS